MTAPIYRHPDALDNGLALIRNTGNSVAIVDYNYVAGDSYATVRGTADANIIVEVTGLTNADYTLAAHNTLDRKCTLAAKSGTCAKQSSGTAGNSKVVIFDTVSTKVLSVHNETSGKVFYVGDTINIPAVVDTSLQPTQP